MIRLALVVLYSGGLVLLSWRDWFKALCGLILMMAALEHPDMPKDIMGIQGLNFWNVILVFVVIGWIIQRRHEGLRWDMPAHLNWCLVAYFLVIIVSFLRMVIDRTNVPDPVPSLVSELLINSMKWVIPGLLLFDGCRTRERFRWAITSILGVYVLFALQVVRWMPASYAIHGDQMAARALKILVNEIGFHRVTMSMMLAGASWAVLSFKPLAQTRLRSFGVLVLFVLVVYAQALTGGRAGYLSWALLGLTLCVVKWRKYLLLFPVVLLLIVVFMPGVVARMTEGMDPGTRDNNASLARAGLMQDQGEEYTITAGRTVAWQFVIEKIKQNPVLGYGRLAMQRTGISGFLMSQFGESFPHPHNAYLEITLDNGIVGFMMVLPFYFIVLRRSISLFRDDSDPLFAVSGGVGCSLVLAFLIASFGSQSFYPVEASVGMWCAIGLMLRVSVERERARAAVTDTTHEIQESSIALLEPALPDLAPAGLSPNLNRTGTQVRTVRNWRAAMRPQQVRQP